MSRYAAIESLFALSRGAYFKGPSYWQGVAGVLSYTASLCHDASPSKIGKDTVLSGQTLLGKILRLPLSLLPRESTIRIVRGPLRGHKWIVGASNHACWAGTYEVDNLAAFASAIAPGATVYDVGANVGIYTLLASLKAGLLL